MYLSIEIVKSMTEVKDTMVSYDSIVVLAEDGKYYSAKQHQPGYDDVTKVPFYPAKKHEVNSFMRLDGTGAMTADKVDNLNEDLNSFSSKQCEEILGCDRDYYEFNIHDAMPGAFDTPWHDTRGLNL